MTREEAVFDHPRNFCFELIGVNGGEIAIPNVNESNFSIAQVYSMCPDGVPGDADLVGFDPQDPANYFREIGALGTGDDLLRRF